MISSDILDEDRRVRIDAVRAIALDADGIFALRSVLATDDDAEVRGLAAERLTLADVARSRSPAARAARFVLLDATTDRSPFVRERAASALGRHYEGAASAPRVEERLAEMARLEPAWHVRRAAVRAIAAVSGVRAVPVLDAVLDDPFWRVRYAAIQALSRFDVRLAKRAARSETNTASGVSVDSSPLTVTLESGGSPRRSAALAFLRAGNIEDAGDDANARFVSAEARSGTSADANPRFDSEAARSGDALLADEDPAVVAARLARMSDVEIDGGTLVALLASPHDVLRRIARRRLIARGNDDELREVLAILDEPRVPYADEAARRVLARASSHAFRKRVLDERTASPSALIWAIEEGPPDADAIPFVTHVEARVRRAAFRAAANALATETLLAGTKDPDEGVRAASIAALAVHAPQDAVALAALVAIDVATEAPIVARALVGALAANIGDLEDATQSTIPRCWADALRTAAAKVEDPAARSLAIATIATTRHPRDVLHQIAGNPSTRRRLLNSTVDVRARRSEVQSSTTAALNVEGDEPKSAISHRPNAGSPLKASEYEDRPSNLEVDTARGEFVSSRIEPAATSARLGEADWDRLRADEDPWIRLAALDGETAAFALESDPDPWVRRGAFELLLCARPSAATLAIAVVSDDPWVRSRAATAFGRTRAGQEVEALLRLTRDPAPMVRASAAESLDAHDAVASACHALVAREPPVDEELRLAAHGRLVREGDARAFDALARDLEARVLSMAARTALLGMALTYPEALRGNLDLELRPRRAEPKATARIAAPPPDVERRTLGKTGIMVAPLGISGAHNLPLSQLERARDAGVNLFFWEPEYRSLESLVQGAPGKDNLVVVCGTYEADAKTIERDVNRALRRLRLDALGVMLLFWVRSPARLSDEAFGALARAKEKGKVRAIGFSTHLRELAAEAIIARPWDVVMARHSAAHPALETTLLPIARERGVGVIAFSALVYGRMLASRDISAVDCYRYTLTQPGVSVCLSAPRRQRELEENLAVLRKPTLDGSTEARLREHGKRVRTENRAFMSLVREP